MSTRIVLADDHHIVRQGIRALLEAEPGFDIAGEAADGITAVEMVERLRPQVLVVDVMMPGITGLEVSRQVTQRFPETRVVMLSMHATESYVLEAMRAGALAYVLKDSTASDLVNAIRDAVAGRRYLSPTLSERAIEAYAERARTAETDVYETLTTREREVIQLAAQDHTSAEIAFRLSISPRTAEAHRAAAMRKLGLRSQGDLIRFALTRGLIPPS